MIATKLHVYKAINSNNTVIVPYYTVIRDQSGQKKLRENAFFGHCKCLIQSAFTCQIVAMLELENTPVELTQTILQYVSSVVKNIL